MVFTDELAGPIPETEPARQQYYMERMASYVKAQEERTGAVPRAHVKTFGCQMNERDSEKLRGILKSVGYALTDQDEDADLILYNTCTVRENANLKVYGRLGYLGGLKKKNPDMIIGLCGCMMQEPEVVDRIRRSYPFVNLIFGTHNIFKVAELIWESVSSDRMMIDIWKDTSQIVEDLPADRTYSFKSGVNIMYGCNNYCTYCIVPYVRGRERSRQPVDILREVEQLVDDGVIEVMLLGQNVNSYGNTFRDPVSFAQLLQAVEKVDGIERIRFMSPHPKDFSQELIDTMASSKKICPHIHLPLQSGSSRLLHRMNRHYTKEDYLELCRRIRRAMPDISLTTDIIVGFPGETEEDFQDTMDVVSEVGFDSAFTFIYSKRTGTPAAVMADQVSEEVVKDRFDRLLSLVQRTGRERSARFQGRTMDVLVEHRNEQDSRLVTGRLANNLTVHFPGGDELIGKIVPVYLRECKGFYYLGEKA